MSTAISQFIEEDQLIQRLMSSLINAVNYSELGERIVKVFADHFRAELCTLWRWLPPENDTAGVERLVHGASLGIELRPGGTYPTYNLAPPETPNEAIAGVTAWIAIRQQVCRANSYYELRDDQTKPWYKAHQGKWDQYQFEGKANKRFKCLLGLPILVPTTGKLIGVLKIESKKGSEVFSLDDERLAKRLMPFVAIALQTMIEREYHEQRRQQALRDLTRALPAVDAAIFYQELVKKTAELLRADVCSLWVVDESRSKLKLGANYGVLAKDNVPEYPLNWDAKDDQEIQGLTPWVIIRKRDFFGERHEDLRNHPAWRGEWDKDQWNGNASANFGCLYAVPLLDIEGKPFGVLKIENGAGKPKFETVDRATFDLVADFIPLAIEFNSRLQSNIVYDFFHLLKQPVTNTISTFSNLRSELGRDKPRQERISELLEMLSRNLETVRIWINNVYGLATRREIPGEPVETISIRSFLDNAANSIQNLFPDFTCTVAGDDFQLSLTSLETKKVSAIFLNILDNSYKYSPPERRRISAILQRLEEGAKLTISDNGRGITPEDLPRVFQPYFSRKMEKWPDSMGLGLSTVERLLHELGWGKELKSELDKGTDFTLLIPQRYVL